MEKVNHPPHYNDYPTETIDMMIAIWGREKVRDYCLINAFKYRMRVGKKDDITQDLAKERWYLDKAAELSVQVTDQVTDPEKSYHPFANFPD